MDPSLPVVIVGVGNDYRKDDGVGLHVARQVRDLAPVEVEVVEGIADGYSLIDTWTDSSRVFVIDCAVSGAEPGRTYRFDALNEDIPTNLFDGYSTHSISLVQAIDLAKTLERLPGSLVVFGIEGRDFSAGVGLSPEVKQAASRLAKCIVDELKSAER